MAKDFSETQTKHLYLIKQHLGDNLEILSNELKTNTKLQTLYLRGNYIDYHGVSCLAAGLRENRSLQELHLIGNHLETGKATESLVDAIKEHKSLRTVYVSSSSGNHKKIKIDRKTKELRPAGMEPSLKMGKSFKTGVSRQLFENLIENLQTY